MQDLTQNDIRRYVLETLESHTVFQECVKSSTGGEYGRLVDEIVNAANGVFLLVRIAITSLLRGMTNEDRVSDLENAIRELPEELDGLYRKILEGIPRLKYSRYAARTLFAFIQTEAMT